MANCIVDKAKSRFTWFDWLLTTAITSLFVALLAMLAGPTAEWWRSRPRPGMQVERHYATAITNPMYSWASPVNYLLYLPPNYSRRGKWPLVMYLHGVGTRGRDLNMLRRDGLPSFVEHGKKFNFILVSPQCPANTKWSPDVLVDLIEHVSSSLSVDRNRIYLTGYSMGGYGTWATSIYKPDLFAAVAPLAGGGDASQAARLKGLPLWAFHGMKDHVVPFAESKKMVDAIRKSGGHVKFTAYPNADHGICGLTYQNPSFFSWLLAQRKDQSGVSVTQINHAIH